MAISVDGRMEEIYQGRGVTLHVAPSGIARARLRAGWRTDASALAEYGEISETRILGGAPATLVIDFGRAREDWRVPGMRRSEAEWAKRAIDGYVRATRRRSLPLHSRRLSVEEVRAQVTQMLGAPPLDITDLADAVLAQAVFQQASDVHILPGATQTAVRWRVDGILRDVLQLEGSIGERLVSRIKVLAALATYEHQIVQEGRLTLDLTPPVQMRVTVVPALHGETVTLRIFDPSRGIIGLDSLGFEPEDLDTFREAVSRPDGMVVLTGPAGAGKTTTLYAALAALSQHRSRGASFSTVEDPVELDLEFASQTEVDPDSGLGFADALKSVLRQDPNVIMLGEIRDPQTAEIAVRAGMTGHLLLTTLHTGGAAEVFPRLAEMGVPPFTSTSALRCIVAQRLVRVLCECAEVAGPDPGSLAQVGLTAQDVEGWDLKQPVGCDRCGGTGYLGRTGVLQVVEVSPELRDLALQDAPAHAFAATMAQLEIPSLHELALKKVQRGITTPEEVARVLGGRQ